MKQLVRPSVTYKDSLKQAIQEFVDEGHQRYGDINLNSIETYIESEFIRATDPPPKLVPETVYWLVEDDQFIGRISLRHYLTDFLAQFGGHIGYEVRPSRRKEGNGKEMLRLLLPKAKAMGLEEVMITCDETNIGSRKIIESNGGEHQDTIQLDFRPVPTMRWWIEL